MNLNNFESHIERKILERGIDYYASGSVVSLEYDGAEWVADVSGGSDYTVTVTLAENGEITDTYCDCPYDLGEYCKHQTAVFYALREDYKSGEHLAKKAKKENFEELLKQLDKETLVSIVMEFAGKNRRMKEEIFLRYENKGDILKHARNVIQGSINTAATRGFVEYADVRHAVEGANTVLKMIDTKLNSGDIAVSVSLGMVVLEEMVEMIGFCDDSNGTAGGVISDAIEKISKAVCAVQANQGDNEKIFDIILNHAREKRYDGWTDWRLELLFAVLPLCKNPANRKKMEQYFSKNKSSAGSEWSREYEKQQLQRLQYEIIKRFDNKAAADSYMEKHVDNSDFRKTVIQNAISKGFYNKALSLCLDGESKDKAYAGLVCQWKELRFTVYKKTKNIQAQKTLGMELLQQGNFEYFLRLKALYTKKEWPDILKNILEKITDSRQNYIYVKILIYEKLKPQLLEYCKKHSGAITSYYEHLLPDFKDDVGLLFINLIKKQAENAYGRSDYSRICELLRHYKKACGKAAYAIRDELAKENAKRPAFLDELSRV